MRWICQALLVVVLLHGCRDVAKAEDIGCPPPLPAAAKVAFEHKRSVLVVKTAGSPNHRGQDVVAAVGEPQVLIGKFAYGTTDKDIKDEGVEVFVQRHPPCGDWQLLGTARTSKDGEHGKVFGIEDDGGRVFFTVPEAERLPVGRYPVRMRLVGDGSEAASTSTGR